MQSSVGKCRTCFHGFRPHLFYSTNAISSATSTSSSTDCVANYLVDYLGFSHNQALSTTFRFAQNKVNHFKFSQSTANSVVNFFKIHGFDDTHIRKIVISEPRLLNSNAHKTFERKFKFLQDQGFSGSDVITVVSKNPRILFGGSESRILPAIHDLRQVLGCDNDVIAVIKKLHSRGFSAIAKCLLPNVALLESYGIPIELIRKHLIRQATGFLSNPKVFKAALVRVEHKLGIPRNSPLFLYVVHIVTTTSEQNMESKFQLFKSFGWTDSEVQAFVVKNAICFSSSEASLKKKLDFLMNELQLKPAYLTACGPLFTCSLEKRTVPRHKVLLILKEKSLVKKIPSLYTAITMSEPRFLERFVIPFKEVHQVYDEHTGCGLKTLAQKWAGSVS